MVAEPRPPARASSLGQHKQAGNRPFDDGHRMKSPYFCSYSLPPIHIAVPSGFIAAGGQEPISAHGAPFWPIPLAPGTASVKSSSTQSPLPLVALGVAVAFRAGIFNLGGDGQFICGAVFAVAVAPAYRLRKWAFSLPLFLLTGCLGGRSVVGGLVGWLRARIIGANENDRHYHDEDHEALSFLPG